MTYLGRFSDLEQNAGLRSVLRNHTFLKITSQAGVSSFQSAPGVVARRNGHIDR
jgi:hypothetical protein